MKNLVFWVENCDFGVEVVRRLLQNVPLFGEKQWASSCASLASWLLQSSLVECQGRMKKLVFWGENCKFDVDAGLKRY